MINTITMKFKKLNINAIPFSYSRKEDACLDMYALKDKYLQAQEICIIPTGIAVEIPEGYEGQIRGRSGLALNKISVHVGTVESTYRGDVGIIVTNTSYEVFHIKQGTRLAQFTLKPVYKVILKEEYTLTETSRGENGFGSSGV